MTGKLDLAIAAGKAALENPVVREAAENAAGAAERLLKDTMPKSVVSAAKKAEGLARDYFRDFDSSHYRDEPVRSLATEIRTGGDVSMRTVDGPSRIVFDENNKVQHVLFNRNMSDAERADHLTTAAYAGLIHNDVLAKEAAGKVISQSAGYISRPIERFATQEEMQQNAMDGARAYVGRDEANANKFTAYLTERFGPQSDETQMWSRHIVNGDGPENIFSTVLTPQTSIMEKAVPLDERIKPEAEPMRWAPWLRPTKGVEKYVFTPEAKPPLNLSQATSIRPGDPLVSAAAKTIDEKSASVPLADSKTAWKK